MSEILQFFKILIRSGFVSSVLECVRREGDRAEADEGEGEDDQPAEGLSLGQDDDKDELDRVHGGVQPILDLIETHFRVVSFWFGYGNVICCFQI